LQLSCNCCHPIADAATWLCVHDAISAQKQDSWIETALHYAAAKGHSDMANLLLAFGADPTATNFAGRWCMQPDQLLLSLLQQQFAVLAAVKLLPLARLVANDMATMQHLCNMCQTTEHEWNLRAGNPVAQRTRWLPMPPAVPDTLKATAHYQATCCHSVPARNRGGRMVATSCLRFGSCS
jgi:hypothetical protein